LAKSNAEFQPPWFQSATIAASLDPPPGRPLSGNRHASRMLLAEPACLLPV